MKLAKYLTFFFILIVFLFASCSPGKVVKLSKETNYSYLDSIEASQLIVIDKKEKFFKRINVLDMGIQMKKDFPRDQSRKKTLEEYRSFLKTEVCDFTKDEKKLLKKGMSKAYEMISQINPEVFPTEIKLIKTHGNHYGDGVWYTRENAIIIPKSDIMEGATVERITDVLVHEIFHIWSRYHPGKKRKLYSLIGFKNMFGLPMIMDQPLKDRILLNPDGMDLAQVIKIKTDSNAVSAIPILTVKETRLKTERPGFFELINFDLYQVVKKGKAIRVASTEDGRSTVNLKDSPSFHKQIKDNTTYVIHPDEIMADNFLLLSKSKTNPTILDGLSAEGKKLVKTIQLVFNEQKAEVKFPDM